MEIKTGQPVYTSDGEKLGTVAEVTELAQMSYFRVDVTMRPDYWLAATWVERNEQRDGADCLVVGFPKERLDDHKVPKPA